ncbi:sigma-54-dependent transcriptional regulator [Hymenobacter rigui]|uniref:Sigma-54-dependent Fis family transcriptional regulator n=1 Tax=Hymenobacter rigui TaxID=334424 RepID=A0A3R9P0K6_9BACT|nr:sigma-54 dependent transcriptional regulator [Hymenobacter rigui]RSK47597.1 sigma-54-dependent Fis family transcriptional regulator [Hymenobacter rigui]
MSTPLPLSIVIVEDDPWYGQLLQYHLSLNPDYQVRLYTSGQELLRSLGTPPDVVTIDVGLPDMEGRELLRRIREQQPELPIIIISAQSKITTAVELLRMGATDYLVKDEYTKDLLWNAVLKIRETTRLRQQVRQLQTQLQEKNDFQRLLKGNSPAIQRIYHLMERATQSPVNISITGETGTGKELVAKAVHLNSERSSKPFVAVNMAAIPSELLESELFGHEKGAFTGAIGRKIGKFEQAHGGTLFLDEIGELSLPMQAKLLRVLQERELQRVGGNERIKLNVRLITATHKNLADEVMSKAFREDLYYRVIGLPIELPPLRERGADILFLAQHFLQEFCQEQGRPVPGLSEAVQAQLLAHSYPGNVRELKTIMELAAALCNGQEIQPRDLMFTPATSGTDSGLLSEQRTLREYSRYIIRHHLDKYDHNVPLVARKLDIGKSTIYKMVQDGEL